MIEPKDLPALSREELLALVVELQRQIAELRAEIDQLKRGGKRQAAPFSKGSRVANPKPPGRKPGSGPFRYREAPPPEAITEPPVDVKVTLEAALRVGGPWRRSASTLPIRPSFLNVSTAGDPVSRVGLSVHGVWPPRCVASIRTWRRTKLGRQPTAWGRG